RIGPYNSTTPLNVKIHDNTFVAISNGAIASPLLMFGNATTRDLTPIEFYDNTFQTNNALFGASVNATINLLRTHIEVVDPVATPAVFGADYKAQSFTDIHSRIKFV